MFRLMSMTLLLSSVGQCVVSASSHAGIIGVDSDDNIPSVVISRRLQVTSSPTSAPSTLKPTSSPTTDTPTSFPTTSTPSTAKPTSLPTAAFPTASPVTFAPTTTKPTSNPITASPTSIPTTLKPGTTFIPTPPPSSIPTSIPTQTPSSSTPTSTPTTLKPGTTFIPTNPPTTLKPTTDNPTYFPTISLSPTTKKPSTSVPTTKPTTAVPTTLKPTVSPTVRAPCTFCPGGVTFPDLVIPGSVSNGRTCSQAAALAANFLTSDSECVTVQLAEPVCCPKPTSMPTQKPTARSPFLTKKPTESPNLNLTLSPSLNPTLSPTLSPDGKVDPVSPSLSPTLSPTLSPDGKVDPDSPSLSPALNPTMSPTLSPLNPTISESEAPTISPTLSPSLGSESEAPTISPTLSPNLGSEPEEVPTISPTLSPGLGSESKVPTISPTLSPSLASEQPSPKPTPQPLTTTPMPVVKLVTMVPSALAITEFPTMNSMEPSQAPSFPPQVVSTLPTYINTLSQPPTIDQDLVPPAPSNPGDPISPSPTTIIIICQELAKPAITVQIIMPRSYSYYGGKSGKAKSRKRQLHNMFGGKSGKGGKSEREERDIIIDNDSFYELYCQNLDEMIDSSSSEGGEAVSIQNDDVIATNIIEAFSSGVERVRIPVDSEREFTKGLPVVVKDEIEDVSSANVPVGDAIGTNIRYRLPIDDEEAVDNKNEPKKVIHYYYPYPEVAEFEKYAPLFNPIDDNEVNVGDTTTENEEEFAHSHDVGVSNSIPTQVGKNVVEPNDSPDTNNMLEGFDFPVMKNIGTVNDHPNSDDINSIRLGRLYDSDVDSSSVAKSSIHGLGGLGLFIASYVALVLY